MWLWVFVAAVAYLAAGTWLALEAWRSAGPFARSERGARWRLVLVALIWPVGVVVEFLDGRTSDDDGVGR